MLRIRIRDLVPFWTPGPEIDWVSGMEKTRYELNILDTQHCIISFIKKDPKGEICARIRQPDTKLYTKAFYTTA